MKIDHRLLILDRKFQWLRNALSDLDPKEKNTETLRIIYDLLCEIASIMKDLNT